MSWKKDTPNLVIMKREVKLTMERNLENLNNLKVTFKMKRMPNMIMRFYSVV